jgi:hypothetical protein
MRFNEACHRESFPRLLLPTRSAVRYRADDF